MTSQERKKPQAVPVEGEIDPLETGEIQVVVREGDAARRSVDERLTKLEDVTREDLAVRAK